MSTEDKPSGSLILDGDIDSERADSTAMRDDFGTKCRTEKERSPDLTDTQPNQALIVGGMGEGLEASDTIVVKKNNSGEQEGR